jgi:putative membrane protein
LASTEQLPRPRDAEPGEQDERKRHSFGPIQRIRERGDRITDNTDNTDPPVTMEKTMKNPTVRTATLTLALAAAIAAPSIVLAQTPPPAARAEQPMSASKSADSTFAMKAAEGGLAEVEVGKLATQQAKDEAVKTFGQRMVDDHGKANDELKSIASSKGITLPTSPSAKHKALAARLQKLQGAAFDKAYMTEMVKDHQEDIALFEREATSGKDPELQAFAKKTLPTLKEHQELAKQTHMKVAKGTN